MAAESAIEWCDSTFNGWTGCTAVSPCCTNCYAEALGNRLGTLGGWGSGVARKRTGVKNWSNPLRWNARADEFRACDACGWRGERRPDWNVCPTCENGSLQPTRRRVFSASLSDWLDNEVPVDWLADLLDLVRRTPSLDWLVLSKRIGLWRQRLLAARASAATASNALLVAWIDGWLAGSAPENVWVGATVGNQTEADRDVPKLLAVPARIRFVSIEPMLGPIDLTEIPNANGLAEGQRHLNVLRQYAWECSGAEYVDTCNVGVGIDWVICGGESGPRARPVSLAWVRSLRDQCAEAGVPFLFKQWGAFAAGPVVESSGFAGGAYLEAFGRTGIASPSVHVHGDGFGSLRMRGKESGKELDGRVHLEWPTPAPSGQGSAARG